MEEITDWMAYETSVNPSWKKKEAEKPKLLSPDEQADQIRMILMGQIPNE
jgi:hypothetical protein